MFLTYNEPLFRPPSEANSLILQLTYGCSHNKCTFCYMYKTKIFKVRPLKDVLEEIEKIAPYYRNIKKIFLADGDALVLPTKHLLAVFQTLKNNFPYLEKISLYANPENILKKNESKLKKLQVSGLTLAYLGIESGNNEILTKVNKGAISSDIITAIKKAKNCGIKISATVILGLGGKELSSSHIDNTTTLINNANPDYLSCLVLMLDPFKQEFTKKMGNFTYLNKLEILTEMGMLIRDLNPKNKIIFRANHASNYLPLKATLPHDKEKILQQIADGLKNPVNLVEDNYRGL